MGFPYTKSGYNMYDMFSLMQKAIRRNDFNPAGFAAKQLADSYRTAMWNRLLVISAEDCFGIITKEIVSLRQQDDKRKNDGHISRCVALLCKVKKSRDACYFACNFILASRNPRQISYSEADMDSFYVSIQRLSNKDFVLQEQGVQQDLFAENSPTPEIVSGIPSDCIEKYSHALKLKIALAHRDMDMIGYHMGILRMLDRKLLWDVFLLYATTSQDSSVLSEIYGLLEADRFLNLKKQPIDRDEIFISKAVMVLCQSEDPMIRSLQSAPEIRTDSMIDWNQHPLLSIRECTLVDNKIPEWTFDCHTLKGKKMGKTDWDMTTDEQAALTPLEPCYFDEASWLYTYEDDYQNKTITYEGMLPIWKFAETHPANPVEFIPY